MWIMFFSLLCCCGWLGPSITCELVISLSLFFFALISSFSLFCCIGSVFAKHNISTVERLLGACVLSLSNTLPHTHVSGIAPLRLWTPHLSGKRIGRSNVCVYCWMGHCIATLAPCVGLRFTSDTLVCSTRKENVFLKAFCSGKDFSALKEWCVTSNYSHFNGFFTSLFPFSEDQKSCLYYFSSRSRMYFMVLFCFSFLTFLPRSIYFFLQFGFCVFPLLVASNVASKTCLYVSVWILITS